MVKNNALGCLNFYYFFEIFENDNFINFEKKIE